MLKQETKNRFLAYLDDNKIQIWLLALFVFVVMALSSTVLSSIHVAVWKGTVLDYSDNHIVNALKGVSGFQHLFDEKDSELERYGLNANQYAARQTEMDQERQLARKQILEVTRKRILLLMIPIFLAFGWGTVWVAHKVVEPLYRFKSVFRDMKILNLRTRMYLEKHHEGQRSMALLNESLEVIDSSVSKMKRVANEVEDSEVFKKLIKEELDRYTTSEG